MAEVHTKMSKKIAQLTKVIYQLNTKNEDTESKLKHLQDKHKSEVEALQGEFALSVAIEHRTYKRASETLKWGSFFYSTVF